MRCSISFTVILLALLFLSAAPNVMACSCLAKPSVLDEFERSQDVFIGEISGIEKTTDPENRYGIKGSNIVVQKIYKGDLKEGDKLFFDQGNGADCRLTYGEKSIGTKMLIYSTPYQGRRAISICGRSRGVDGATEDLKYLDNLAWSKGKTRISGDYSFGYFEEVPEGQTVANKIIRIVGQKRSFITKTDLNGFYELYDIPPGIYYLEPEIPPGWKLNQFSIERTLQGSTGMMEPDLVDNLENTSGKPNRFLIKINPGRHVSFDFQFKIDNALRGRLLKPDGTPLVNICVHAIPTDREESLYGSTGCSQKDGKFEITELLHEEYILVINGDNDVSGRIPIPKTFFPGVTDRSKARSIKMAPGLRPQLGDFKVPKLLETVKLKGFLRYSDGSPVRSRKIQFDPDDDRITKPDSTYLYDYTEADGSFEIIVLKGQSGRLRGEFYVGKKTLEACPSWRAAVIEDSTSADWMVTAITPWMPIKADKDNVSIEFVFPFNQCKDE